MRKLAVLAAAVLTAAAAVSSQAAGQATGDGCLVVREGRGVVAVAAKGTIFGRLDLGRVTIDDPVDGDGTAPRVYGAQRIRILSETKTLYIGTDLRFRMSGRFRVRVEAVGMDLSAVGRGSVTLTSDDFLDAGEFSVDMESFCEDGFEPVPDVLTRYTIGPPGAG